MLATLRSRIPALEVFESSLRTRPLCYDLVNTDIGDLTQEWRQAIGEVPATGPGQAHAKRSGDPRLPERTVA